MPPVHCGLQIAAANPRPSECARAAAASWHLVQSRQGPRSTGMRVAAGARVTRDSRRSRSPVPPLAHELHCSRTPSAWPHHMSTATQMLKFQTLHEILAITRQYETSRGNRCSSTASARRNNFLASQTVQFAQGLPARRRNRSMLIRTASGSEYLQVQEDDRGVQQRCGPVSAGQVPQERDAGQQRPDRRVPGRLVHRARPQLSDHVQLLLVRPRVRHPAVGLTVS